jgi:hypothetical protein
MNFNFNTIKDTVKEAVSKIDRHDIFDALLAGGLVGGGLLIKRKLDNDKAEFYQLKGDFVKNLENEHGLTVIMETYISDTDALLNQMNTKIKAIGDRVDIVEKAKKRATM